MILKPRAAEGRFRSGFPLCRAGGPTLVVLKVFRSVKRIHRREPRVGKWETCSWFSTFPSGAKPGCGNVGISRRSRDFQGAVGRVENLLLVFHAFHGPVISTALLLGEFQRNRGGTGDSILHCRNSFTFAAPILRAHSVSLVAIACRSNCANPMFGFRYWMASGSDFSFSYGVA
jgi:hypothetical protein